MGLLDFFKKKKELLAMPMFKNGESFELKKVIDYLETSWNTSVTNIHEEGEIASFRIQGEIVALAIMPIKIPFANIKGNIQYAYNWPTAEKDIENHNSFSIVKVMSYNKPTVERFGILTKLVSSIVATSNCMGVYQSTHCLLISREQYLDSAEALRSNQIPFDLWEYPNLRKGENVNNKYTYGLSGFGKLAMEDALPKLDFRDNLDVNDRENFFINTC